MEPDVQQTDLIDLGFTAATNEEAVLYTNTGGIELGAAPANAGLFMGLNILLGLLGIISIVGSLVMFLYILIDVIRRTDLKENKLLWVLLLLFISPVGMLVYGFVENRKKLAWWSLGFMLLLPVVMAVYAVVSFVAVV
jgi:hypothetical protein